jgi:hypothetical protein
VSRAYWGKIARASHVIESVSRPARPADPPLIAGEVWQQVIDAAGGQCECESCSSQGHIGPRRCNAVSVQGKPLHAVPRDATLAGTVAAMRLATGEMRALCAGCHNAADYRASRAAGAKAAKVAAASPGLFDAEPFRKSKKGSRHEP